jgi:uncharacterized protein Usg
MANLEKQLIKDYRLTTAEIYYHMPDFPELLQSYVWQDYDIAPRFPVLNKFLVFWSRELDGKLHSVYVASHRIITPGELRHYDVELTLQ